MRAWLATVISPMVSALAAEQERLARKNWSFRCWTQDFEYLWPVEKMVAVPYVPNLRQLLRYKTDIKKLAQEHDSALEGLRAAAVHAYERARQNDRFRFLVASNSIPESDVGYLAEYVVNGIRDLGSNYTHQEMWSRVGGEFLDLRDTPALGADFNRLKSAGQRFAKAVRDFRVAVTELQNQLSDQYRLPPVEPADAVRA